MKRTDWSKDHDTCMNCGKRDCWPPLATHEILRGSLRSAALKEPSCWLRLCDPCHRSMDSLCKRAGVIKQIEIKLRNDAVNFSLERFNKIAVRRYRAIEAEEIVFLINPQQERNPHVNP